jgi:hypothetical protein
MCLAEPLGHREAASDPRGAAFLRTLLGASRWHTEWAVHWALVLASGATGRGEDPTKSVPLAWLGLS